VQGQIDSALEGMVPEEDVQGQIDAALVGMVSEQDVTPLNCSEGTAVNAAGDACEPTAEYRAAAFEEGRDEGFAAGAASVVIGTHEFKSGVAPDPLFVDACGGPACNQEGQVCYSTDESHHVSHAIRVCRSERWTDVLLSDRCKYVWALEQGGLSWPNGGAPFHFGGCSEQPRYDDEWRSKLNICQPSVNAEGFYRDPCADEELNTCMAECRDR
jgi:hypothetical protein